MNEMDNAVNGVLRETNQRFDLKGTKCGIERNGSVLTVTLCEGTVSYRRYQEVLDLGKLLFLQVCH